MANARPNEFDYVVAGGGSAGCVIASRLTEDPGTNVCLLEAGGSGESWVINMPFGIAIMLPTPIHNWAFHTVPQPGLDGRRGYQPRGRALGGSSFAKLSSFGGCENAVHPHCKTQSRKKSLPVNNSRRNLRELLGFFGHR